MTEALLKISNTTSLFVEWSRVVLGSSVESNYYQYLSKDLAKRISSKDLKEVYENYGQAVFRLAKSLLRNRSAAEDLVHDVFIRFWTTNKYEPSRGTKLNYLLMLTKSMALNQLNKTKNRKRILNKWISFFQASWSTSNKQLEVDETTVQIQLALGKLPAQQRQVLELCYIEGASQNEVAEKLGIPLGTVKSYSRRGLISLRASLSTDQGESQ